MYFLYIHLDYGRLTQYMQGYLHFLSSEDPLLQSCSYWIPLDATIHHSLEMDFRQFLNLKSSTLSINFKLMSDL